MPELSFHGTDAWQPDFSDTSHSFGVLYSDDAAGTYLYITYNMYWETTRFALPALPQGYLWTLLSDTSLEEPVIKDPPFVKESVSENAPRSIRIFAAKQCDVKEKKNGKGKEKAS